MKEKLVSKDMVRGVHPIFRKRIGNTLIKILFSLTGVNKANSVYDNSKHLHGIEFVTDMLDKMGIKRAYKNIEVLDQFKGKPFITTSNHPYGHIDGIIEIETMGKIYPNFKVMVNWVLQQIDTMEEFFIGVNPFPKKNKMSTVKSSVGGIIQCLDHLKAGNPLGLFPSGGVSLPNLRGKVVDREWQLSTIKLIKKARVPIVPIYISGSNSLLYQLLGYIGWRARTLRLLHELTNKKGKTITVHFGEPISVEEQDKHTDIKEFGEFLWSKTYEMMK